MDRRLLINLLLALVVTAPVLGSATPSWADDGSESDSGSGGGGDSDKSDDDGDDDNDNDDDDDDDDDDDGEDRSGKSTGADDHDDALRAVKAEDALTLRQILALFARQTSGTVIDVTLVRRHEALVYRVKYVDAAGRVKRIDFDAVSGTRLH